MSFRQINQLLGNADIYLIDQILKGRFENCMNILDAGCGEGRNLRYFVKTGRMVVGVDQNPSAIRMARMTYKEVDSDAFICGDISDMPLPNEVMDLCICSAVLHFAKDDAQFRQYVEELYRVLKPGAYLFIRMATEISSPESSNPGFTYLLGDQDLAWISNRFEWVEPFKTVVVEDRSMAVLMLAKKSG